MALKKTQVDVTNSVVQKRGNYTEVLQQIIKEGMCPFCEENLMKHHAKPVLFKNKSWIVTTNAWPYEGTKHHFLLITRVHLENAEDASPAVWKDLGAAYKKLVSLYAIKGGTLAMRSGDTRYTGASVKHLHAQVIVGSPRKEGSATITYLSGFYTPKKK